LSKLIDEEITLGKKRRILEAQINGLLNRERFRAIDPTDDLQKLELALEAKSLQTRVLSTNPRLKVKLAEVEAAKVDIELARKDYWPDVDLKVAYGQRDESQAGQDWPDFFSTSLVMNIPLWKKTRQDKNLKATQLRHTAAVQAYQNLASSLPHKIDALVIEIQKLEKSRELVAHALIVQAGQWARSALSAYEVGKVNFNTAITAQMRLLRFELQAAKYVFDIYEKRAELEALLGASLSSPPRIDPETPKTEEKAS
jgi:outer membrane protein TolC